jgi:hypothetical protein
VEDVAGDEGRIGAPLRVLEFSSSGPLHIADEASSVASGLNITLCGRAGATHLQAFDQKRFQDKASWCSHCTEANRR